MSRPLSIRFDRTLLDRLRRRASAQDTTPSGLAQRLVDEGLRVQEHPGVMFRDGPSGHRAALVAGPDVWEVVAALRYSSARGEAAVTATATEMGLSDRQIKTALDYYGSYPDEIDEQVAENERAADEARAAWQAQQRLLA
ncbi:MAG TPA: hypothetical protein VGX25_13635 [Actinophytocola sp.]|uniref:hypothetical protein n=1 Tax=Actinophytocola sp. TaxID=1872138 RepID=UPI002DDCFE19|nr:hypothetical protein [Actinophytocola sp.]HEV2780426.1 hypothetical protein [Actinophytocola sp.]